MDDTAEKGYAGRYLEVKATQLRFTDPSKLRDILDSVTGAGPENVEAPAPTVDEIVATARENLGIPKEALAEDTVVVKEEVAV